MQMIVNGFGTGSGSGFGAASDGREGGRRHGFVVNALRKLSFVV